MAKSKLTVRFCDRAMPSTKDKIYWDADLPGFGLKVTPTGKKAFLLYYRTLDHIQRKPRIGYYPEMRPEQARKVAQEMLADVRKGGDPSSDRQAKRAGRGQDTVRQLFSQYKALKESQGRRSIAETERLFVHDIFPVLGGKRVEDVTSRDITRLLDATERRSRAVAGAVRRQLSAFFNWAMPRLPPGAINPMTNASRPAALRSRERVLTDAELKALWKALDSEPDHWRLALRLLILTGQRREEVLGATWAEVDLSGKVWTIPAARSKNDKAHLVPLSDAVIQLLANRPNQTGKLFPKGVSATSKAARRIRDAMPAVPHWRWHDLRRTVASGMQRLGVRLEVTEAVLNHTSGTRAGIAGVYQRYDYATEKRDALEQWSREVARIIA